MYCRIRQHLTLYDSLRFGRGQSLFGLVYKMPGSGCRSVLHSDGTGVIVQVMYMCDELKARFSFYFSRCMSRKHIVLILLVKM